MRRLWAISTVMVSCLAVAVVGGVTVAQDPDPWSRDWLEPTEEGAFGSAGHDLPSCVLDKSEREHVFGPGGSGKEIRNLLFTCEVVFSDPRLTGTQTTRLTEQCFGRGGCVNWGTMDIVGADGAWSGWFQGTEDPTGQTDLHIVLTGSGAYEGLLAAGELALIRDDALRGQLGAWPSHLAEWAEEEDAVFTLVRDVLAPYVGQRIPLRTIRIEFPPFADGEAPPPIPGAPAAPLAVRPLLESAGFENLVYRRTENTWHAMRDGETLRARVAELLDLIRSNLAA